MSMIGSRFYTSLDNAYLRGDIIEHDLSHEIENGRLFRLITKLNIILERQELSPFFSFALSYLFVLIGPTLVILIVDSLMQYDWRRAVDRDG